MPRIEYPAIKERCRCGRVGLFPTTEDGLRELARIADGTETLASTRTPRNIKHHALAWCLAQKLAECVDWLHDRQDAMDFLKIKCRHVRMLTDHRTGELHLVPKSIAFASMTQEEFSRFFDRAVFVICSDIVPGLDSEALRREVLEMCDGDLGRRARRAA